MKIPVAFLVTLVTDTWSGAKPNLHLKNWILC